MFAPGIGAGLGPTLGLGRSLIQGLFYAPLVIGETLRGLDFAASLFALLGYRVDPLPGEHRTDIVQAIRLGSPASAIAFARGLQRALPINARFAPEPGPVPGYVDPVIMSSGAVRQRRDDRSLMRRAAAGAVRRLPPGRDRRRARGARRDPGRPGGLRRASSSPVSDEPMKP